MSITTEIISDITLVKNNFRYWLVQATSKIRLEADFRKMLRILGWIGFCFRGVLIYYE
jgi:hypothetical protein